MQIVYLFLALMGLGFLIFFHELGHYFMARWEGIRVEVFSIGMGKPVVSWEHKGVRWQLCWIFFGGYVRLAGSEPTVACPDLEKVVGGFYSKTPWARIRVALAGPVVNLGLALALFGAIYLMGGQEKPFGEFTRVIGDIDPGSELYAKGVRSGDELLEYNGDRIEGFKDLIYASILNSKRAAVEGNKIDYFSKEKTPYDYHVTPYEDARGLGFKTIGVLAPARYLVYRAPKRWEERSSVIASGLEDGDRIVWVNGELVFSAGQLSSLLNEEGVLIHYLRGGKIYAGKVPRVLIEDLQLDEVAAGEIEDLQYAYLQDRKQPAREMVPYLLSWDLTVQGMLRFVGGDSHFREATTSSSHPVSRVTQLCLGDRIVAVGGVKVEDLLDLVDRVGRHDALVVVKRGEELSPIGWKEGDRSFESETHWQQIAPIVESIGTDHVMTHYGAFHLLSPIAPITSFEMLARIQTQEGGDLLQKRLQAIKQIKDIGERERLQRLFQEQGQRRVLGLDLQDRTVIYNPTPFELFYSVSESIVLTIVGLFKGNLSPKELGGPVMITQVMQRGWTQGLKEALFWLGAISINLGIFNLLPIPILDGGRVCISLVEAAQGRPVKPRTLQRLMIPFFILFILFFIYVTYNDLMRIFF